MTRVRQTPPSSAADGPPTTGISRARSSGTPYPNYSSKRRCATSATSACRALAASRTCCTPTTARRPRSPRPTRPRTLRFVHRDHSPFVYLRFVLPSRRPRFRVAAAFRRLDTSAFRRHLGARLHVVRRRDSPLLRRLGRFFGRQLVDDRHQPVGFFRRDSRQDEGNPRARDR